MALDSAITAANGTIPCYRCGYDVRAQPPDGICPECAASVEESRKLAAIPIRPAWRDSDPRWRRRILAGLWVLVLLPVVPLMGAFQFDTPLPWPSPFGSYGIGTTLLDTFLLSDFDLLLFCIGMVLLFSRERCRSAGRFDWTRRWGVLASYLMLFLGAGELALIVGLVLTGIAAVFQSMPVQYQPAVTDLILHVGTGLIYYGPKPGIALYISTVECSSGLMLLASAPLYAALRSCGSKRLAIILLAPLVGEAILNVVEAVRANVILPKALFFDSQYAPLYFDARELASQFANRWHNTGPWLPSFYTFRVDIRWLVVTAIAVRLSIAQIGTYRPRG